MSDATQQAEIGGPPATITDAQGHEVARTGDAPGVDMERLMMHAMERGEDAVEALERLIALQERREDRNAERAMAAAMAAFQGECPAIGQTEDGHHGTFAPLKEIVRVVRPILGRHGLTFAHDGEVGESGRIRVTCTLRHVAGASRTATFEGPPDTSGGKNPIQEMASTRSYLRRYTLIDVLGLTTEDDDDGAGADPPEYVTESQAADLASLADEVGADRGAFLRWFGVESFEEVPKKRLREATQALERKRAKSTGQDS